MRGSAGCSAALAALLLVCGCAGYRLGSTSPDAGLGRSLQVNGFRNETTDPPRLAEEVNQAFRKAIQRDGTYRLNTSGNADIVLNGTLLSYTREGISYQPRDTLTASAFEISVAAKVVATDRNRGTVLLDREVRGKVAIHSTLDLASAERQALPLLAADLAQNAISALTESTW